MSERLSASSMRESSRASGAIVAAGRQEQCDAWRSSGRLNAAQISQISGVMLASASATSTTWRMIDLARLTRRPPFRARAQLGNGDGERAAPRASSRWRRRSRDRPLRNR
jgi:hypothetical protein